MIVIAGLTACTRVTTPTATSTPSPAATPAPIAAVPLTENVFFVAPDGDDANPGTFAQPWATANHAAEVLEAGQTVYLRGGLYPLPRQVRPVNSGRADAWITYRAYPGEQPVLDASAIDNDPPGRFSHDAGSFTIERNAYIRVIGLTVQHSHQAGFMVRDAQHIELINRARARASQLHPSRGSPGSLRG